MKEETQLGKKYEGWLVSSKLWKRGLAVLGHYLIGALMFYLAILVIGGAFWLLAVISETIF